MDVFALVMLLLQPSHGACPAEALAGLARAAERRDRSGAAEAAAELASGVKAFPDCVPLVVANWTITGWIDARNAASKGGSPESLAPARTALAALDRLASRPAWRVQSEYARAAITAAMAAAQDERSDMSLFLTHARALSDRLALTGDRDDWPGPIDEIEGELWLEVDRYADARKAYERAVERRATPSALSGLARASDRLKDEPAACAAYRRAVDQAGEPIAVEARTYLARPGCRP